MTGQDDEAKRANGPRDDPWRAPEVPEGSWLTEQSRLLAAEEGFAD